MPQIRERDNIFQRGGRGAGRGAGNRNVRVNFEQHSSLVAGTNGVTRNVVWATGAIEWDITGTNVHLPRVMIIMVVVQTKDRMDTMKI